jgi:hypothetical protein
MESGRMCGVSTRRICPETIRAGLDDFELIAFLVVQAGA